MDMQSDFDRILFFEHARKTAEATYAKNPLDADVSTSTSLALSLRSRLGWLGSDCLIACGFTSCS